MCNVKYLLTNNLRKQYYFKPEFKIIWTYCVNNTKLCKIVCANLSQHAVTESLFTNNSFLP